MNSTNAFFAHAQLALASYTNLASGKPDIDKLKDDGHGMSPSQADRFSRQWLVIGAPYDDPVTGAYAVVFENVDTHQRTLAIRGTQGVTDYLADYFILDGTPSQLNPQYAALETRVQAWLGDGTLTAGFTVTGHSLGGYLAAGLVADFPAAVAHAYLYNAPGNNSLVTQIMQALGILASPDPARISSLRADAGISPIAALGNDFAPPIRIAIENPLDPAVSGRRLALNHSQQVLTEALAVHAGMLARKKSVLTTGGAQRRLARALLGKSALAGYGTQAANDGAWSRAA